MAKITHIFKTYFPETNGGLEEAIRQIGRYAVKQGYEVEVVAAGSETSTITTPDGITARFFKKDIDLYSNPFSLAFAERFSAICDDTDILHYHFTWPTAELMALLCRKKKPVVVTFHCDIHKNRVLKACYMPVVRQFLSRADTICISSRKLFQSIPFLQEMESKTEEICYWLDEERFSGLPEPDQNVVDYAGAMKPYGLFAGVLRWYKGLDVLLDASRTFGGNILVVGRGPLYGHLKKRIARERLHNVHLLGFQPDSNLKALIRGAQFIVLPSTSAAEAFGQILLEGLYFSKPLISTELGTGTSLVNRHNHTGIVVRPGCPERLSMAMNRMVTDHPFYERMTSNACRYYRTNFTQAIQGGKYSRLYAALLKG